MRIRRKFSRLGKFRELMLTQLLRRQPIDFSTTRPMVAIIGDHISDQIRAKGLYEREILELLRDQVFDLARCSHQVALDVGANIGNHSIFLSDIFKSVIGFEPNPITRSILQVNVELNQVQNVEVRAVGLSAKYSKEVLFFAPSNLGAAHLASVNGDLTNRSSEVELAVGDDIVDRAASIGFIKIDVEGAELQVLQGLEQTLRAHQPLIMMEQWPDIIDERTGSSPPTAFLRDHGYSIWDIRERSFVRGRIGKLISVFRGSSSFELVKLERLAKRPYSALLCTPRHFSF